MPSLITLVMDPLLPDLTSAVGANISLTFDRDVPVPNLGIVFQNVPIRLATGQSIQLYANDDPTLPAAAAGYGITVAITIPSPGRPPTVVPPRTVVVSSTTPLVGGVVPLSTLPHAMQLPGQYVDYAQYVAGGYTDHGNVTGAVALDSIIGTHALTLTGDATATINDTAPNGMVVGIYAACASHTLTVQDSTAATLGTLTGATALSTMVLSRVRNAWLLASAGSSNPPGPPTAPSVPTGLATSAVTAAGATLTWAASTDPNGAAITYQVSSKPSGGSQSAWVTVSSGLTYAFTGFTGGTAYTLYVRATSTGGTSASASIAATTVAPPPGIPANVTATPATGQITVTWTQPTTTGPLTGYEVQADGGAYVAVTGLSKVLTGFTAGTAHSGTVRSVGTDGTRSATINWGPVTVPVPALRDQIVAANPLVYLPLTDPVGTTVPAQLGMTSAIFRAPSAAFGSPALVGTDTSAYLPASPGNVSGSESTNPPVGSPIVTPLIPEFVGVNAWTIEMVAKFTTATNAVVELVSFSSASRGTQNLRLSTTPGSAQNPLLAGSTFHIAVTWDGAGTNVYVNGALSSGTRFGGQVGTGDVCRIGGQAFNPSNAFTASHFAIHTNVLSAATILAHAKAAGYSA